MKKLLFTFVLLMAMPFATAQVNYNTDDVLYLKNGSVIRGQIVEIIPGGNYTINTHNGSKIIVAVEEIERVVKEVAKPHQAQPESVEFKPEPTPEPTPTPTPAPAPAPAPATTPAPVKIKRDIAAREKGYFGALNFSYAGDLLSTYQLRTVNGHRFNQYVAFGVQTGFDFGQYGWQIPLMAHLHMDLAPGKIRPIASIAFGYNLNMLSGRSIISRGFIFESAFGFASKGFTLSLGYFGKNVLVMDNSGDSIRAFLNGAKVSIGVTF